MNFLSNQYSNLEEVAEKHSAKYQSNNPYPHIYFRDFLNEDYLKKVLAEFPDLKKKSDVYYDNPNEKKHASKGESLFGENTKALIHYFNSEPFLEFLQELTGIEETLLPDPYLIGGGFHEIKRGGFLKLHVDFHKHAKTNLDRRLNLLVYLNEDWDDSYGGHFELWEKDMSKCAAKIPPNFNTVALFSTTGDSWHGHPDPLNCPEDRSRKSLALYYYTNGRPEGEISNKDNDRITTTFAARKGQDSGSMKFFNWAVNTANAILPGPVIRFIKSFRNK